MFSIALLGLGQRSLARTRGQQSLASLPGVSRYVSLFPGPRRGKPQVRSGASPRIASRLALRRTAPAARAFGGPNAAQSVSFSCAIHFQSVSPAAAASAGTFSLPRSCPVAASSLHRVPPWAKTTSLPVASFAIGPRQELLRSAAVDLLDAERQLRTSVGKSCRLTPPLVLSRLHPRLSVSTGGSGSLASLRHG